jgi:hypothetical protein
MDEKVMPSFIHGFISIRVMVSMMTNMAEAGIIMNAGEYLHSLFMIWYR